MPIPLASHRTRIRRLAPALVTCALACATARPALALWSANPAIGTPFCVANGDQWPLAGVTDGAGGAIVAWVDGRDGITANGIYAQRLDLFGRALWPANGVALVANTRVAQSLGVATDGAGGLLVAWSETRGGTRPAIYVQRLDANGLAKWGAGGVALCPSTHAQKTPALVSDGVGGAIVAWQDSAIDSEVVVRRIDANGVPGWSASGVALSSPGAHDLRPRIATDASGGAIVAWTSGTGIAVRRLDSTGLPLWPAAYSQVSVKLTDLQPDGLGGALVAWTRSYQVGGVTQQDGLVQRLDPDGSESWLVGGLVLDTSTGISRVQLTGDGAGGAFAVWEHATATASLVRGQRIGSSGSASWTSGGLGICPGGSGQFMPHLVGDGAGGIIVVFEDSRSGSRVDAYAQRMSGAAALMWGSGGAPVCTAPGSGVGEALLVAGPGSTAIAMWDDFRTLFYESDLYATRILWTGGMGPTAVGEPARGSGALALETPFPQPARGLATFRYRATSGGAGRLELFDLAGRRARSLEVTLAGAAGGAVTIALTDDAGAPLPSGAYTVRLSAGADAATTSIVVIR